MTARLKPLLIAILSPLWLFGCVVTPGKFVSTLKISADRSFAFTYVGEVHALDLDAMGKGIGSSMSESSEGEDAVLQNLAAPDDPDAAAQAAAKAAEKEKKYTAIAEALRKEAGYRRADHLGKGVFAIDYAISGKLTHGFAYPYNVDAEIIVPFLAVELRGRDIVRVKAPAFAAGAAKGAPPGMDGSSDKLDGIFTLTTDAEIVSQNTESEAVAGAGGKTITWRATPLSKDAPMAVLRVAGL